MTAPGVADPVHCLVKRNPYLRQNHARSGDAVVERGVARRPRVVPVSRAVNQDQATVRS